MPYVRMLFTKSVHHPGFQELKIIQILESGCSIGQNSERCHVAFRRQKLLLKCRGGTSIMRITHELGGTPEPLDPIVKEQLLNAGWGTEDYPADLLRLRDDEQRILHEASLDRSIRATARRLGLSYQVAKTRYYMAVGKQEASGHLSDDVLTLSPLAQRIVVLNSLFGATWTIRNRVMVITKPEVILRNTKELDELLGRKWRRCPQLSVHSLDHLKERIARYDSLLGPNWRNSLVLLTLSPDVIEGRAAQYNAWLGEDWKVKPSILTNNPDTVKSSARALKTIGITRENTSPGSYLGLLVTTVAHKRQKAAIIRRSILGHQHVYIRETKKPISENVRARTGRTCVARELEAQEIEEFKAFVRHLGARGLGRSIVAIKSWATKHGYPVSAL